MSESMPDPDTLPDPEEAPDPNADPGPFDGGDGPDPAGGDPTAEATGRTGSIMDALRSTEPHTPLEDVEDPFAGPNGGRNRLFRGFQKATRTEGVPAWVDLLLGGCQMMWEEMEDADAAEPDPEPEADTGGPDMGGELP